MSAGISSTEFKLLRDYIEERCGIALGEEKAYLIETRLTKLMALNGCDDFTQFHRLIKNSNDATLHDKIIDAMTTNETLWFRDTHPFVILREKILPDLVKELRAGKRQKVRIWSAASCQCWVWPSYWAFATRTSKPRCWPAGHCPVAIKYCSHAPASKWLMTTRDCRIRWPQRWPRRGPAPAQTVASSPCSAFGEC